MGFLQKNFLVFKMSIRFLKLSLASPDSIRSWTERILPNGKKVGKILKGDLIDYKNGLPIRDGLSCERIFGPMVSFTCSCGRFKCIETRGVYIVHDTLRSSRQISPDITHKNKQSSFLQWSNTNFQPPLSELEETKDQPYKAIQNWDQTKSQSNRVTELVYIVPSLRPVTKFWGGKGVAFQISQKFSRMSSREFRLLNYFLSNISGSNTLIINQNDRLVGPHVDFLPLWRGHPTPRLFGEPGPCRDIRSLPNQGWVVPSGSLPLFRLFSGGFPSTFGLYHGKNQGGSPLIRSLLRPVYKRFSLGTKTNLHDLLKTLYTFIFQIVIQSWDWKTRYFEKTRHLSIGSLQTKSGLGDDVQYPEPKFIGSRLPIWGGHHNFDFRHLTVFQDGWILNNPGSVYHWNNIAFLAKMFDGKSYKKIKRNRTKQTIKIEKPGLGFTRPLYVWFKNRRLPLSDRYRGKITNKLGDSTNFSRFYLKQDNFFKTTRDFLVMLGFSHGLDFPFKTEKKTNGLNLQKSSTIAGEKKAGSFTAKKIWCLRS